MQLITFLYFINIRNILTGCYKGDLPWEWLGEYPLCPKLCRVWELSQVQATKSSNVTYIIRILSLELWMRVMIVVIWTIMINVINLDWCLTIKLHDFSLFKLAYPSCICLFCVSFSFAMIALNDWREHLKVQVRIHPSWIGVE